MKYKFITKIDKKTYEKFVKNHPTKSHFLQSYAWGEFCQKKKNMIPHYVGLQNEKNELVATALLLEKKLPLGFSYFYSPRGFVIDFFNNEILSEFTKNIKIFAKKYRCIFIKIDPDIVWKKQNYLEEEIRLETDPQLIFNSLTKLGFKHQGFTKNFETMQPRYTFRIDMNQKIEDITNKFSKTTKQRISKSEVLDINVRIGTIKDIPSFSHLMDLTENRKGFVSHDLSYYENLYKIYNEDNKMNLFIGTINVKENIKNYITQLQEITIELKTLSFQEKTSKSVKNKIHELEKKAEKLKSDIKEYKEAQKEFGDEIILNGHVIIEYGDKAWVLYAGNHNILTSSYSNYKTYYNHINYCYTNGIKTYDQFGTIGDLSKDNPILGLHEFKKKFGGDYIEFIGEFDLVTNKFLYLIFNKLVPFYRNMKKKKLEKKKKNK